MRTSITLNRLCAAEWLSDISMLRIHHAASGEIYGPRMYLTFEHDVTEAQGRAIADAINAALTKVEEPADG